VYARTLLLLDCCARAFLSTMPFTAAFDMPRPVEQVLQHVQMLQWL